MKNIPEPIKGYLEKHRITQQLKGFLCLNDNNFIASGDGEIGEYKLGTLEKTKHIEQSIPFLEGLLPNQTKTTSIINNVHIDNSNYFDIHFLKTNSGYWILFIDTTGSAKKLQQEQQLQLDLDLINDKRRTGS